MPGLFSKTRNGPTRGELIEVLKPGVSLDILGERMQNEMQARGIWESKISFYSTPLRQKLTEAAKAVMERSRGDYNCANDHDAQCAFYHLGKERRYKRRPYVPERQREPDPRASKRRNINFSSPKTDTDLDGRASTLCPHASPCSASNPFSPLSHGPLSTAPSTAIPRPHQRKSGCEFPKKGFSNASNTLPTLRPQSRSSTTPAADPIPLADVVITTSRAVTDSEPRKISHRVREDLVHIDKRKVTNMEPLNMSDLRYNNWLKDVKEELRYNPESERIVGTGAGAWESIGSSSDWQTFIHLCARSGIERILFYIEEHEVIELD